MLGHEEVHQTLDHIGGGTLPWLRPGLHYHHYQDHNDRHDLAITRTVLRLTSRPCLSLTLSPAVVPSVPARSGAVIVTMSSFRSWISHTFTKFKLYKIPRVHLNTFTERLPGDDVRVLVHQLVQVGLAPRVGVGVAEGELVALLVRVEGEGE